MRRAAWTVAVGVLGVLAGVGGTLAVQRGHGYDFGAFYSAAEAVRWGDDPYRTAIVPPYVYPPLVAQVGAVLPRASRTVAYRGLSVASALAAAAALGLVLLYRARRVADDDDLPALALGLALLWVLPFRDTLAQGQVNTLALLAVALALWFEARGRPVAAGVALAPAVLLKVTPAAFALWWLARRRTASLRGLAGGVTALVLGSIMAGGWPFWASYARLLRGLAAGTPPPGLPPLDALYNLSLAGFCARVLPSSLAAPAALVAVLGLAVLVARAAARAATPPAEHAALLAVLALVVVAPPLAYRHHVVLLFPALLLVLADAVRERAWLRGALVLLAAALAGVNLPDRAAYLRLDAAGGAARLLTSLNLYGLLALAALGCRYASGGGRRESSGGTSAQAPSPAGT
jgi:alpha-1,2-mannosyltransferase